MDKQTYFSSHPGFKKYGREDYDGPDIGEPTWYTTYKLTKEAWSNRP